MGDLRRVGKSKLGSLSWALANMSCKQESNRN